MNFSRFRGELFNEAMNTENSILGQYGLLFIFLNTPEWEALPGNLITAAIAAVPAVPGGARCVQQSQLPQSSIATAKILSHPYLDQLTMR